MDSQARVGRPGISEVRHEGELLAIIVWKSFDRPGINFLTSGELSQQLAYMHHPPGHVIRPHVHNSVARHVKHTQEVLVMRKGRLRVDFYRPDTTYVRSYILSAGDLILLIAGGHGFEVLEELEMFEIKQGPYVGEADKTRFSPVATQLVRYTAD